MSTNNGLRYPDTTPGMSIGDFKKWTVSQLKEFLGDRGINRDGLKEKVVINAYSAYTLDLPAENVDPQTEEKQLNISNLPVRVRKTTILLHKYA